MTDEEADKKREAERVRIEKLIELLREIAYTSVGYQNALEYYGARRPRPPLDSDDRDAQDVRRHRDHFGKALLTFLELGTPSPYSIGGTAKPTEPPPSLSCPACGASRDKNKVLVHVGGCPRNIAAPRPLADDSVKAPDTDKKLGTFN